MTKQTGQGLKGLGGTRSEEEASGTHWWTFEQPEPWNMAEVFGMYLSAIQQVLRAPRGEVPWFCYTTVITQAAQCCASKADWLARHRTAVMSLATRSHHYSSRLDPDAPAQQADVSRTADQVLLMSAGNAVSISLRKAGEDFDYNLPHDLAAIGPIEHVVLQFWQLQTLDRRTLTVPSADAVQLQAALGTGLQEYERPLLNYGTAAELADHLQGEMQLDRIYNQLRTRVETLSQVAVARSERRAQGRTLMLAYLTLMATALFALPAVHESIGLARASGVSLPSWFADGEQSTRAVYVYVAALSAVAASALGLTVRRLRPPRLPKSRRIGQRWKPAPLTVSLVNNNH